MDPLSITASIIAVLGTGGGIAKCFEKIRKLKKAPDILSQLNNEVSDLHLVVRAVDELYRLHGLSLESTAQKELVCNTLERARHGVLELEKIIEYTLIKETEEGTRINILGWLGTLEKVKEIRTTLRSARKDLHAVWGALTNKAASNRIALHLQEVHTTIHNFQLISQEDRRELQRTTNNTLARNGRMLELMQQELRQFMLPTNDSATSQSVDTSRSTSRSNERITQTGNTAWSTALTLCLAARQHCNCSCSCHQQKRIRTPSLLKQSLGSLFLGYVGLPGIFGGCNLRTCQARSRAKAHVCYMFPAWFVELAITVRVELSLAKGPEMLIRCLRVRPFQSAPFQALSQNQDGLVKSLVNDGRASVLDVAEGGISLLYVAVQFYCEALIKDDSIRKREKLCSVIEYLLQAGADIHQEDNNMITPYQVVWQRCLIGRLAVDRYPILQRILGQGEPTEIFGFSDLHATILNLGSTTDFDDKISSTSRNSINRSDRTGRTALSWAAELGEIEKMRRLLLKGADPNIADTGGRTPLLYCASDIDALTLLLEAGAEVNHQDSLGYSKLSRMIRYREAENDVRCLEVLWKFGASLSIQHRSRQCIHWAIEQYVPNSLAWLLRKGINLEARTVFEETPLLHFIACNSGERADTLAMLLDMRVDLQVVNVLEEGLPHYMARCGSFAYLATLQARAKTALGDVDRRSASGLKYGEKAGRGKTAMELAEWRRDRPAEWMTDSYMSPDPDPQAYFLAFQAWIDATRAEPAAGASAAPGVGLNVIETQIELEGHAGQGEATEQEAYPRLPGAFPHPN